MWQVLGQPRITRLLERSLQAGELAHAYVFAGPPHVGKLTLATNLAQAVNCVSDEVPCQQCPPCRRIAAGKHADVQKVDLLSAEAKNIGIKQIEDMQMAASLPPYEGKRKVFILDNAELLSQEAANRMLKTLEEPPPKVHLILLTRSVSRLLPTVLSRCQHIELRPLSRDMTRDILVKHFGASHDKADLLSRLSGGCLGWAILALRDDTILQQREQRIAAFVGLSGSAARQRLAYAAELAAQFAKGRDTVTEIISLWLQWWHDLLLIKGENEERITNIDYEAVLRDEAQRLTMKQIHGFVRHLQGVGGQLEQNVNPRLAFEVLLLKMP